MILYSGKSIFDSLAQPVEHVTFNHGVRGSIPRWIIKRKQKQTLIIAGIIGVFFYFSFFINILTT